MPKPGAFQPDESENVGKADNMYRQRPWHKDTKTAVVSDIEPYGNGDEDDIQNRDDCMPILVIILLKERHYFFHGGERFQLFPLTMEQGIYFGWRFRLPAVGGMVGLTSAAASAVLFRIYHPGRELETNITEGTNPSFRC